MNISTNTYANTTRTNNVSTSRVNGQNTENASASSKAARTQDQIIVSTNGRIESAPAQTGTENLVTNNPESQTDFIFEPVAKYIKYTKTVDDYYAKQNEENMKFSNPPAHIYDKYYNKNSEYYIQGLTKMERDLCANNERNVLSGLPPAVSNYDPIIQKTYGGLNAFSSEVEYNQEVRAKTNDAINKIFAENGIVVPEGADLKLTVDPYDFKIRASGVDDELARAIETALNKGKNGVDLYYQMEYGNPGNWGLPQADQFREGDSGKRAIFHVVKELTGYDIREMDYENGKIYTSDGRDLWDVLSEKAGQLSIDGKTQFSLSEYSGYYNQVAQQGWDTSKDFDLTIGYKNGSLYDIDTNYGYGPGQTDWQDKLFSRVKKQQEEYRTEREETLRREESGQSTSIFTGNARAVASSAREIVEDVPNTDDLQKQLGLYGLDGTFYPLAPVSQDIVNKLNLMLKNGLKPLNEEVMRIS